MNNIRNFVIIAHIDHGKSTLADRFLELTNTIARDKLTPQYLDRMTLEKEHGITIKMHPVRMLYEHSTRINADRDADRRGLLYEDLTYKIRGALFNVYNKLGPSYKEIVYRNAIEEEFKKNYLLYKCEKVIDVIYDNKKVGIYKPDFIINNEIILEIKAQPFIGKLETKQVWYYLKGSRYRLALLVNFGAKELQIKRIICDTIRDYPRSNPRESAKVEQYLLNLIDTPGHVDFTYEVSRALAAVEGAVLLVDGTQGIQAQTLSNLLLAKEQNLKIIGVINKIDLKNYDLENKRKELAELLKIKTENIVPVSAKTGENVDLLLEKVVSEIPPPIVDKKLPFRALIFDSHYDYYKGVIAYIRVVDGSIKKGEKIVFTANKAKSDVLDLGYFAPQIKTKESLESGEIGWLATGLKDPGLVRVGDTIVKSKIKNQKSKIFNYQLSITGYKEPKPMVFAGFYLERSDKKGSVDRRSTGSYFERSKKQGSGAKRTGSYLAKSKPVSPANQGEQDFENFRYSLSQLKLNDSALYFTPENSEVLGRGYRLGFLGMLHLKITQERLKGEYGLDLIVTHPTVPYRVLLKNSKTPKIVTNPGEWPSSDQILYCEEPWVKMEIITPRQYLSAVLKLINDSRGKDITTLDISDRLIISCQVPLEETIKDFYDNLKSISSGYASLSYEISGYKKTELEKLTVMLAGKKFESLSRIVFKKRAEKEARNLASKLKEILPRQNYPVPIQVEGLGRIIARETLSALKKDVTGNLYGGDRTRKMKLWKKQQKGKKRLLDQSNIQIPPEVFLKIFSKSN